ncbi:hypothetical protein QFZ22_006978 [Streptomyces canus]|uniref:Major facilitator superfamily (MFS) profile domain-containing protein n=2 Tax=Streptomyces canus TaxID=58343 RepID=A0AAW8FM21_9ACTN|nr:hypothetical protein [Streptomyces canus]
MRADLGMSESGLQWVVNAYAIAFAGFMLLGGRAGDLYGRKRMFLVGLGLFTAASLAGGLAQGDAQLLIARAVQGLGAAVLAPATLTIVTSAVPEGAARARAIATWTAVGAGGGAAGGFVGGLLVDTLSWRWVLLINVPVGSLVLLGSLLWLTESRSGDGRRLDLPGAVLVTGGLAVLAYGISQTEAEGWTAAATLLPLAVGLALVGGFLLVESRTAAPLMPLGLLRVRAVASANAPRWAKKVVLDHDAVAVEDFRPKFLARTTMARKAADAAIGATKAALIEMGRKHGRDIRLVHPAHTTMDCARCDARAKHRLPLGERTYTCTACGNVSPRDKNSARVMLVRAGLDPAGADGERPPGALLQEAA